MQIGYDECVLLTETVKQGTTLMWAGWKFICFKVTQSPMGSEQNDWAKLIVTGN